MIWACFQASSPPLPAQRTVTLRTVTGPRPPPLAPSSPRLAHADAPRVPREAPDGGRGARRRGSSRCQPARPGATALKTKEKRPGDGRGGRGKPSGIRALTSSHCSARASTPPGLFPQRGRAALRSPPTFAISALHLSNATAPRGRGRRICANDGGDARPRGSSPAPRLANHQDNPPPSRGLRGGRGPSGRRPGWRAPRPPRG